MFYSTAALGAEGGRQPCDEASGGGSLARSVAVLSRVLASSKNIFHTGKHIRGRIGNARRCVLAAGSRRGRVSVGVWEGGRRLRSCADRGAPVGLRRRLFAGMQLTFSFELAANPPKKPSPASCWSSGSPGAQHPSSSPWMDGGAWEEEEEAAVEMEKRGTIMSPLCDLMRLSEVF